MDTDQVTNTAKNLTMGNKVLGGAGAVALVSMFLPWYKIDLDFVEGVSFAGRNFTFGWMGMLLIVAAAGIVLAPAFGAKSIKTDTLETEQIALGAAVLGTILWLIRLISMPGINAFDVMSRSFGLYVAIVAAGAAIYGIVTSMKEKGIAMPKAGDFKGVTSGMTSQTTPQPPNTTEF